MLERGGTYAGQLADENGGTVIAGVTLRPDSSTAAAESATVNASAHVVINAPANDGNL